MPIKSYFPTLLAIDDLAEKRAAHLNKDLEHEAYVLRDEDVAGGTWSKKNYAAGYTSYSSVTDLPVRSPNFAALKKWIDSRVTAYAKTLELDMRNKELVMDTCWVNVMGHLSHHSLHLHPLSAVSGTYYVKVPRGSGMFKIEDPRMACFMGAPARKQNCSEKQKRFIEIEPKPGRLVLFESWLRHEVPANLSKTDRISVSFNYSLRE